MTLCQEGKSQGSQLDSVRTSVIRLLGFEACHSEPGYAAER